MKKTLWLLVAVLAAGLIAAAVSYPKVGGLVFAAGISLENKLYGLEAHQQDIGELSIPYYRGGTEGGQAIVMVHGYTADKTVWPRFARFFVDSYDVIIPDLAGHGDAAFDPTWDYSQQAQAERIVALMDKLDIERIHIIGNSMGGYIAAYFALAFPERTLSATMVDPAGVISPERSDMERLLEQGENPFEIASAEDFSRFYPMTMAKPPYLPKMVLDATAQTYMDRRERYAQIFKDIHGEPRLTARLSEMQVPSLLIWGEQDRLIDVSAVSVWREQVPNLYVRLMPEIGHMPMVEAPEETAAIYQTFLDTLPE